MLFPSIYPVYKKLSSLDNSLSLFEVDLSISVPLISSDPTFKRATFGFSFEKKKLFKLPISFGFQINQDRAGDSKLNTFQINPSVSYNFSFDSLNRFSAGAQIGFTKQNIDYNPLYFDAQYNGSVYDPSLSNQENFSINNNEYLNQC